ncbi:MAG: TA system VapC family ribonuclease toxin [Acidobacteriota bacterium]
MKIVDANVLLYAVNEDAHGHDASRRWLEASLSGVETVGFAWIVLLAFLRISTRSGVFARPLAPREALDVIDAWLASPCAIIAHPSDRHGPIFRDLVERTGTGGNGTTDAHLAALTIEHGAELWSWDRDFARFPGLTFRLLPVSR